MNDVQLNEVTYRYREVIAVDQVSLTVERGEFFALLGPSGSGKTTILRLIAGLLEPQHGTITIGGREMVGIPPYDRNIGFVFQNYALFPHLTVGENIAFGLESRRLPTAEIRRRVADVLELVQLGGFERRRPNELSGGQQQRVALARAIVTEPSVLLLDEPLAALDKKLRLAMQVELRELQQRLAITTIFVTHDQEEALTLADRIAVMNHGQIIQSGPARLVYEQPRSCFVTSFLGEANLQNGIVSSLTDQTVTIRIETGESVQGIIPPALPAALALNQPVTWAVRPENVFLSLTPPDSPFVLSGTLHQIAYQGASLNYHVYLANGTDFVVFAQSGRLEPEPSVGQTVYLTWPPHQTLIFPGNEP